VRPRRHTTPGLSVPRFAGWPRPLRDLGLIAATFVVGYAVSVFWFSGPVLADDRAVPRVLELPEAEARRRLAAPGFRLRLEGARPNGTVPRGAVVWQDPPPGMILPPNTVVQVVLSSGPASITVPDVAGLARPSAEKILQAAGVAVGTVDVVVGPAEAGVVLATRPGAGNGLSPGARVDLVVSGGAGGAR